jgi:hypothetical protein
VPRCCSANSPNSELSRDVQLSVLRLVSLLKGRSPSVAQQPRCRHGDRQSPGGCRHPWKVCNGNPPRLRSTCGRPRQRGQARPKRPYSDPAVPASLRMMPVLAYSLMARGLSASATSRSTTRDLVLARLGLNGHTRPHGVVFFCHLPCANKCQCQWFLGRQPAKSGSSLTRSQRSQEGSHHLIASFLAFSTSNLKAPSLAR